MDGIEVSALGDNELRWRTDGPGSHGPDLLAPEAVNASLSASFRFIEQSPSTPGLRAPQLGALHAVLAHRSTESDWPITIVMPTGTGKTETMMAVFCHSPKRTLVVVPSDALRSQTAAKFLTLGKLPEVGAVTGKFRCPSVLVLRSALSTAEDVDASVGRVNIVVATAQALTGFSDVAKARLVELCDRLFVDEAHHVAARTWREIANAFGSKEVVQFTATPYREDGQHLDGTIAYAYPLRLAQKNNLFARINYRSVVDLADPDRSVAVAAIAQLRADLDHGLDHLLMARVSSIARSREVVKLYGELAPDLAPVRLDTGVADSVRAKRKAALIAGESKIVVCVNMLGEGFDLPELKVAAIHDPQKSLAVTLQFIGRFTRVGDERLGEASAFVPLQVAGIDHRLRKLYGEDSDWNEVIEDLTEHAVGREQERSDFEKSFSSLPREVAIRSIHPKMSTVTYRSSADLDWDPESIYDLFENRLLTTKLGINNLDKVVWWVSEEVIPVRWGDFSSFNELVHHLYVVHVDTQAGFLYVNSTNNDSLHDDIAQAIGGAAAFLVRGETVYRILSRVARRVPTNVGLLDAVSRTRRFSMHVGQDVLAAWRGEGGTKMKTNIFAHGFADGRAVSFGASRKGRVWSHQEATDIDDWVRWARQIGPVIADEAIDLGSVMSGFLLPEPATERPPYVPLAIEWPHELVATLSETRRVSYRGQDFSLLDTELRLSSHTSSGPLRFQVVTTDWSLEFQYVFDKEEPPRILPVAGDARVETPQGVTSLAAFLTQHGLLVTFEDEMVLVEQGFMLRPDRERRLMPISAIEVFNWDGIDIRRESQGQTRDSTTVQYRTIEALVAEADWEIVVDDDGTGELADIVLMRRGDDDLELLLVHCKYSSQPNAGARIGDLYDVCGQAMKMNRAKSVPELLTRRLLRRETNRQAKGTSGLIVGSMDAFATVVREARYRRLRATVVIVQPGMSKAAVTEDMRALLGGTERFLEDTFGMKLRVIGHV
ncbi:MAG: DEAD/DEAH box helicase family protein [Actinobacteria bacterium]|nr:DEAD/DEAH box helicase family protein [Actinomycetota bacterium]